MSGNAKRPLPKQRRPLPEGHAPTVRGIEPGPLPEIFFDEASGSFYVQKPDGEFGRYDRVAVTHHLKSLHYSDKREFGGNSPIEDILNDRRFNRLVRWAGSLAGHWAGQTRVNGKLALVIDSPTVIEPTHGKNVEIWNFFRRLLGNQQAQYLFAWLKVGRESMLNQTFRRGPAIMLVGQKNHGKTMAGWLIKKCFGDRSADPTQVAQGDTLFNSHLFGAEFIFSDDKGGGHVDHKAQKKTTEMIRTLTADKMPQSNGKYKTPLSFDRVFWRVMYGLNDGDENLKVLPALDREFMDKVMIFQTVGRAVEQRTFTDAQFKEFEGKLLAAIPDFLGQLERWTIPASILTHPETVDRWSHDVYHSPEVLARINLSAPQGRLLELIDMTEIAYGEKFTARAIEEIVRTNATEQIRLEAKRLLDGKLENCGTYLSRLADSHPHRVKCSGKLHGRSRYIILPPKEADED